VKVDHERLVIEKDRAEKELAALRAELISVADYEINPNSPKQLIKYFYEHKKITPYVNRKTGQPTVDDTALQRIINRYHLPEAMLIQKIRRLGKLVGTYMDVTLDEDARVRCSYNTMQLQSQRNDDRQAELFPDDIRNRDEPAECTPTIPQLLSFRPVTEQLELDL
jgi:DNA polymerase-1